MSTQLTFAFDSADLEAEDYRTSKKRGLKELEASVGPELIGKLRAAFLRAPSRPTVGKLVDGSLKTAGLRNLAPPYFYYETARSSTIHRRPSLTERCNLSAQAVGVILAGGRA